MAVTNSGNGGRGGGAFVFGSLRRQRRPTPASTTVHDSCAWRSRWVWVIVPGLGFGWGVGVPRKAETKWTAGCTCSTKTSGLRAVPLAVSVPSLFLWLPEYQQRIVIPLTLDRPSIRRSSAVTFLSAFPTHRQRRNLTLCCVRGMCVACACEMRAFHIRRRGYDAIARSRQRRQRVQSKGGLHRLYSRHMIYQV